MLGNIFAPLGMKIAGGIALLFFTAFSVQTIRIEGLKIWPLEIVGFKQEVKTLRLTIDQIKAAQATAKQQAIAERLRIEAEYRKQAEKNDAEYQDKLADANARADRYARLMRTQDPRSASGNAGTASADNTAESSDGPGEDAFVAISRADFDILNENTIRLMQAREWALEIQVTE